MSRFSYSRSEERIEPAGHAGHGVCLHSRSTEAEVTPRSDLSRSGRTITPRKDRPPDDELRAVAS
jgi:hypothetical protein